MLQPAKSKYRKQFRGKMRGSASRGNHLSFGDYGLKTLERSWISDRQIEASRVAISHHTKRVGKLWIRIFPAKSVTAKGAGIRMGSGKGEIHHYTAVVTPGRVLFELAGVTKEVAEQALGRAAMKLPVKTKFISRD